jgi:hypothetical protein
MQHQQEVGKEETHNRGGRKEQDNAISQEKEDVGEEVVPVYCSLPVKKHAAPKCNHKTEAHLEVLPYQLKYLPSLWRAVCC